MDDDIQRLVESLRSPGLESELRGESSAVDAIASTMTAKDSSMKDRLPKKARVASFIAAGIIGFGGVAAAGPAVMDQIDGTPDESPEPIETDGSVPDDTVARSTPTTIESIDDDIDDDEQHDADEDERHDADENDVDENDVDENDVDENDVDEDDGEQDAGEEIDDAVLVNDPDTAFDETKCAEGSHGKTVSSVARSDGRTSQDVVDAAQSSCGKPVDPDQSDDAPDTDADVDDEEADGNTPEPEQQPDEHNGNSGNGNSGNGNGSSGNDGGSRNGSSGNGNGNGSSGNGNGNGGSGNGNGNSGNGGGRGGK